MGLALHVLVADNHTKVFHTSIYMCFDHILGVTLRCCRYHLEYRISIGEGQLSELDRKTSCFHQGHLEWSTPGTRIVFPHEYCAWDFEM